MMSTLREATKLLHEDIEDKMYGHKIKDGSLTVKELNRILLVNYCFFRALESKQIIMADYLHPFIPSRSKYALHDLIENGISPDIEYSPMFSKMNDPAYAFGVIYVALGSSLGGKMISKILCKSESYTSVSFTFFTNAGVGEKWGAFLKLAEQTELSKKQAAEGAVDAFNYFSYLIEHMA